MKIYEIIEKLRNLPDKQKKAIIIVVVCILSFVLGFWWVRSSMERLNNLGQVTKDIKLPQIDLPEVNMPNIDIIKTQTPSK